MEVILKKDISTLGRIGDVVNVKQGYARNYLIPNGLGVAALSGNKAMLSHQKKLVDLHKAKARKESEKVAESMASIHLKVKKRFNKTNEMFGSVAVSEVVAALKKAGYESHRKDLEVPEIKTAGDHKVKVRLPGDVFVTLKLTVEEIQTATKEKSSKKEKGTSKKAETAEHDDASTETPDSSDEE